MPIDTIHFTFKPDYQTVSYTAQQDLAYLMSNRLSPRARWQGGFTRNCYANGYTDEAASVSHQRAFYEEIPLTNEGTARSLWIEEPFRGAILVVDRVGHGGYKKVIIKPVMFPTLDDMFLHLEYLLGDDINLPFAQVSRIDFMHDHFDEQFSDLLARITVSHATMPHVQFNRGRISTIYFNPMGAESTLTAYDKGFQTFGLRSNDDPSLNIGETRSWVRLEQRYLFQKEVKRFFGCNGKVYLKDLRAYLLHMVGHQICPLDKVRFHHVSDRNPPSSLHPRSSAYASWKCNQSYHRGRLEAVGLHTYLAYAGSFAREYFNIAREPYTVATPYMDGLSHFLEMPHPDRHVHRDVIGPPCWPFMAGENLDIVPDYISEASTPDEVNTAPAIIRHTHRFGSRLNEDICDIDVTS